MQFSTFRKKPQVYKIISITLLLLAILISNVIHSQEEHIPSIDSLVKLDYPELLNSFNSTIHLTPNKSKLFAEAILLKAKKGKEPGRIASSYRLMARIYSSDLDKKITYYDSAITYGKQSKHRYYPTILYISKGAAYSNNGLFGMALDNYIKALESAKIKSDSLYPPHIYHNIALLKRKLGKYDEAKLLFKKSLNYKKVEQKDSILYLTTLAELITTYRRNSEIDSAQNLNTRGLKMALGKINYCLFQLNEGIIQYHEKKYKKSINTLNKVLSDLSKPKYQSYAENYNLIDIYLHLGKSYSALEDEKQAIINYQKIDSLVQKTDYVIPEIRPAYEAIINFYKLQNDKTNQLHYINKLLYNDSILNHRFMHLNSKLILDYDTPLLVQEKELIINSLKKKNKQSNYVIIFSVLLILIVIGFLLRNYRQNKKYKLSFELLMTELDKKNMTKESSSKIEIDIADNVVQKILDGLSEFEEHNGFTKKNITSSSMSSQLGTNSKYLTKVIKFYRKKSFTTYINDLRIEYIINRLKESKTLQNYTIKALSQEAGFNSAEVFSKYFYKKTGIYPSYFVKKIQSDEK